MTYFSVPDFEENHFMIFSRFFPDFEENRFLIFKKIVSDVFTILFRFWRKSFFDFRENRFLIFSWFLETRFIKLICIRKNTEKIVCKLRDFNTILSTIYSTKFLVWVIIPVSFPACVYRHSCWVAYPKWSDNLQDGRMTLFNSPISLIWNPSWPFL